MVRGMVARGRLTSSAHPGTIRQRYQLESKANYLRRSSMKIDCLDQVFFGPRYHKIFRTADNTFLVWRRDRLSLLTTDRWIRFSLDTGWEWQVFRSAGRQAKWGAAALEESEQRKDGQQDETSSLGNENDNDNDSQESLRAVTLPDTSIENIRVLT